MHLAPNALLPLQLHALDRALEPLPCPACGQADRRLVWRRDRYFLRVDLSICAACGLVHLARGLSGETERLFYRQVYPRLMHYPPPEAELAQYRLIAGYRLHAITAVTGPLDSVLDVGAGYGFFLDACRAHGCTRLHGLEPGAMQASHARRVLGLGRYLSEAPLDEHTALPFAPTLVTLFHVLEHLADPGGALALIRQLISPDGWLVVEVPDLLADWRRLGLQQVHLSHRSYFSAATLSALLAQRGFAVHYISREPGGIYPGNLRIFARCGTDSPAAATRPEAASLDSLSARIRGQIAPWSIANGYPRAALRLLRLTLGAGQTA